MFIDHIRTSYANLIYLKIYKHLGNFATLFDAIECGLTKQVLLYCFQFLCADTRRFRHSGVQRKESLAE